jgi:hypothetical protein
MFVVERFLSNVVKEYGNHPVSTEVVAHGIIVKHVDFYVEHHLHSHFGKSIIETTIQYQRQNQ